MVLQRVCARDERRTLRYRLAMRMALAELVKRTNQPFPASTAFGSSPPTVFNSTKNHTDLPGRLLQNQRIPTNWKVEGVLSVSLKAVAWATTTAR